MIKTSAKLHAGFILAIAFLLVLGSNRLNQKHFSRIQTTVNSVHEDRVVVQDYIYQLSTIIHKKELRFISDDKFTEEQSENEKAEKLLLAFKATKLTSKESSILNELTAQFKNLKNSENKTLEATNQLNNNNGVLTLNSLQEMKNKLDALAHIQLKESMQMTKQSNKSLDMNMLFAKLELAFLIIIGIAILALIFYPSKSKQTILE
ncbi:MCP four helix bundle domain-containing protein [Maribacter hydrothermalis]|uniref:Chemotaxis methyl-accepting receptor HlyB-like 4HB MCP domain-containing protein n=1 Tax=Maribacter hydrothermalis TaxID=1836467 RepID=A0A1B7Z1Z6_9FLAO|nr:MCP four helix bundle domain-containing protein [Maribacter hydrothermalis]APQ18369.1 hypothetical protein BTR34_13995 [Maribacter hydrothermalis]OBR36714.1 hypothetical protein A9200_09885 [Maribacter hydrothermalis]